VEPHVSETVKRGASVQIRIQDRALALSFTAKNEWALAPALDPPHGRENFISGLGAVGRRPALIRRNGILRCAQEDDGRDLRNPMFRKTRNVGTRAHSLIDRAFAQLE
jgi:hypothetical protein